VDYCVSPDDAGSSWQLFISNDNVTFATFNEYLTSQNASENLHGLSTLIQVTSNPFYLQLRNASAVTQELNYSTLASVPGIVPITAYIVIKKLR
jgi:hypothetical protein